MAVGGLFRGAKNRTSYLAACGAEVEGNASVSPPAATARFDLDSSAARCPSGVLSALPLCQRRVLDATRVFGDVFGEGALCSWI